MARQVVTIDHDRLVHGDGGWAAVVRSSSVDYTTLDGARQQQLHRAFSTMCRTLVAPWQVVAVRRPVAPVERPRPSDPARAALDSAVVAHRRAALLRSPVHRHALLFVVTAPPGVWQLERLEDAVAAVTACLGAAGLRFERLTGAALEETVAEGAGDWVETPTSATLRDRQLRGESLQRFPGVAVEPGWLAPLLDVRCAATIALHFHPAERGDALGAINRKLRDLHAERLATATLGRVDDGHAGAATDAALELRARLLHNEAAPMRVSVTAVVGGADPEATRSAARRVAAAFASTMAESRPTHLAHVAAALTCAPLGRDVLDEGRLIDSEAAATCLPWTATEIDDPRGYRIGVAVRDGAPVSIDPFDTGVQANANVAVLASSGHGKTYAVASLLLEAAVRGVGCIVIDPENEYAPLIERLGGMYIAAGAGAMSLNVFDVCRGDETETLAAVVTLVEVLCGETLDQVGRAHVEAAAVRALRASPDRPPLLADCIPPLRETAPRVATVLSRFCHGIGAAVLGHATSLPRDAEAVGIGLRDLRPELVPAVTYLLTEWLWARIRSDRRHRHVVFDEVGLLAEHPSLRGLLVQLARRCRKYDASLIVATQNAGDLLRHEDGVVIATNPATVLAGGHRGTEAQRIATLYGIQPRQLHQLETSTRGEFLLLAGARRLFTRIDMPALHHRVITAGTA